MCRLAPSVLLAALLSPEVAWAGPLSQCHVVDSVDVTRVSPEWRQAIESLERELGVAGPSLCHGVVLRLALDPEGPEAVRVTATARDGRETSRRVARPVGLSAVAFGLLATIPDEPAPVAPAEDPLEIPPREPIEPPERRVRAPEPWGVSLSADTGVRMTFPDRILVGELEIRGDVRFHAWLLTLDLRAAPVVLAQPGPYDDDSYQETTFALGCGRELPMGRSVLALTGAAGITYAWLENDAHNLSAEHAQLRLAAVARWGYPVASSVRIHVVADGEVAPGALAGGAHDPGLMPLPSFTVGLRLGAEVVL